MSNLMELIGQLIKKVFFPQAQKAWCDYLTLCCIMLNDFLVFLYACL